MTHALLLLSLVLGVDYSVALIAEKGGGPNYSSLVQDVPSLGSGVATSPPASSAAPESLPKLAIHTAPFRCDPCTTMRGYDWSGFDVTWQTGGAVNGYPEVAWTDPRGVKRVLTGLYRPSQVRWSMAQTGVAEQVTDAESAPTPHAEVARVLAILAPKPHEVFIDYGCGDGRWCIAATKTYGCRSVGIEIDPERAAAARRAVADAGLSDRISIIEGDATTVDVEADVGVAYLWPETLEALKPKLEKLSRYASMNHQVPGVPMFNYQGAYVWRKPQPVQRQAGAVWGGRLYSGPLCNRPGCSMCASIRAQLGYR